MNSQEQYEYDLLLDRLNAVTNEYSRTVRELSRAKTSTELELDRFKKIVYLLFRKHPQFAELDVFYDGWTGAANV